MYIYIYMCIYIYMYIYIYIYMKHQPEIKAIDEFGMTMTILEPSNISTVPRLIRLAANRRSVGTLQNSSFAGSLHPHSWPKKKPRIYHTKFSPELETENEGLTPPNFYSRVNSVIFHQIVTPY